MSGGQLNANVDQYLQANAMNTPPPQIASDPLVTGATPIEQLLRVLGLAANLSDAQDNATATEQHAERHAKTREAAEKFAAQDEEAAAELKAIDGEPYSAATGTAAVTDPTAAMSQQLPQMVSGVAGSIAGAVSGILQPLAQIPQQAAQGLQQAVQAGMGVFQQAAGTAAAPIEDATLADDPLGEDIGAGAGDFDGLSPGGLGGFGASGMGGGAGSPEGTSPMSYLGPPPVPSASTAPSSAPIASITPSPGAVASPAGAAGMAGMPMVPPGALAGGTGAERDPKADTKRVSVPPVRNGAPVQGRLAVPPAAPSVVKKLDGKPVVTRRIAGTDQALDAGPER